MGRRFGKRSSGTQLFMLLGLLLVCLTTFVQAMIDYLQSKSMGAYQPTWQRILILMVVALSFTGLLFSYLANKRSRVSPIP